MTRRAPPPRSRALRQLRSLLTEALGCSIAARWSSTELEGVDEKERAELHAALLRTETALEEASTRLLRLEELDQRASDRPVAVHPPAFDR